MPTIRDVRFEDPRLRETYDSLSAPADSKTAVLRDIKRLEELFKEQNLPSISVHAEVEDIGSFVVWWDADGQCLLYRHDADKAFVHRVSEMPLNLLQKLYQTRVFEALMREGAEAMRSNK